jgi:integrase
MSTLLNPIDLSPEWIADQLGHTSTAMVFKHYAKFISKDGSDIVGLLNRALSLS